jgi:hypothetical protein
MTRAFIVSHVFPPIPDRRWDWCAYRDGMEENTHAYGWGTTDEEAIADMLRLEKEEAEYEEEMQAIREGRCTCEADPYAYEEMRVNRNCPLHGTPSPYDTLEERDEDRRSL